MNMQCRTHAIFYLVTGCLHSTIYSTEAYTFSLASSDVILSAVFYIRILGLAVLTHVSPRVI